jgi:tetratricopeptide (TPR) repeat protein
VEDVERVLRFMTDNSGEEARASQEDMMIPKGNVRLIVITVICFAFVSLFISGCSTTKNLLGYLKFWEPKQELAQDNEARKVTTFVSQVRPAKGNSDAHYRLATYYQKQGRHQEAINELRKVISIDPQHAKAYNGLGVSYDNLKKFDEAQQLYRIAMVLAPEDDSICNNMGYSLALKGDYESAVEILKKGIALNPENAQLHNNLAIAYAGMSNYGLALEELQTTNNPAQSQLMLGQILQQNGRLDDAESYFATATLLDPSLEAKIPEKDRFIAKISRSIKQVEVKAISEKNQGSNLAKNVAKPTTPARTSSTDGSTVKTEKRVALQFDFMINRVKTRNRSYLQDHQNQYRQPTTRFISAPLPVRHAGGLSIQNRGTVTEWF